MGTFTKERKPTIDFRPSTSSLEGCCGVMEIFRLEDYPLPAVKSNSDTIVARLKELTSSKSYKDYYDNERIYDVAEAIAIITINERMKAVWAPILKKASFSLKNSGNNKSTDNNVYLWTKIIHRTKRN